MPRLDGTGPMGKGAGTGRRLGTCASGTGANGRGRGFGFRNFPNSTQDKPETTKKENSKSKK